MKLFAYNMRPYDELPFFEKYAKQYGVTFSYTEESPTMENLSLAAGADVVDSITTPFSEEMLDKLKEMGVRCLTTRTIGYDHIPIDYAKKIGLGVTSVSYSPDTVADYTIMLMLIGLRKLPQTMIRDAAQDFTLEGKIGRELKHCTVGVIGIGRIGEVVVRDLAAFGSKVLAYDVYEKESLAGMAEYVSLDELLAKSDIITLHAPGGPESFHMIGADQIAMMKEGAIIINCARGSLIDTQALLVGLESGRIGFAVLDVIEQEKDLYYYDLRGETLSHSERAALKALPNVLVTPHVAFYTEEAVSDMVEHSIIGALKYLDGAESPVVV